MSYSIQRNYSMVHLTWVGMCCSLYRWSLGAVGVHQHVLLHPGASASSFACKRRRKWRPCNHLSVVPLPGAGPRARPNTGHVWRVWVVSRSDVFVAFDSGQMCFLNFFRGCFSAERCYAIWRQLGVLVYFSLASKLTESLLQ